MAVTHCTTATATTINNNKSNENYTSASITVLAASCQQKLREHLRHLVVLEPVGSRNFDLVLRVEVTVGLYRVLGDWR